MRLSDLGEFGFIERISAVVGDPPDRVLTGIGDDTAVIDMPGPLVLLVGTDAMVQGRHFRLDWMSPEDVGRRAAAACMSDIAAMGGRLICLFATTSFPADWTTEQARDLVEGMNEVAKSFGAGLAGGDTTATDNGLFIDIVAVGEADREEVWLRSGTRGGDLVFVTGTLGDSAAALALLSEDTPAAREDFPGLFAALLAPTPRLREVPGLHRTGAVTACIDISDGLIQDAGHIAEKSGVGIEIDASCVPMSTELRSCSEQLNRDGLKWAATGGEDFELLFTAEADHADAVLAVADETGTPVTQIGRVIEGDGVCLLDEDDEPIEIETGGWDHFRRRPQ